jgi:release factor glutamine methyltransferase
VATVGDLLSGAVARLREAGSETPRLDAEVLLAHTIGAERTTLLAHPELTVGDGPSAAFEEALTRRSAGEPVAYIRGIKEFFGLALATDGRALIPRPETEGLVEAGRTAVMTRLGAAGRGRDPAPVRIVDIGTGSGAIIVALAVELRRRKVNLATDVTLMATDASSDALGLARENAVGHAVADVIEFVEADLLPPAPPDGADPIDVILANLPYVRSDAIGGLPVAASFEPVIALDGGPDGFDVARRLLGLLPAVLAEDGVALLEIGADQGSAAPAAVEEMLPGWAASVETDLAGLPRVLRIARRPGR